MRYTLIIAGIAFFSANTLSSGHSTNSNRPVTTKSAFERMASWERVSWDVESNTLDTADAECLPVGPVEFDHK